MLSKDIDVVTDPWYYYETLPIVNVSIVKNKIEEGSFRYCGKITYMTSDDT